MGGSHGYKLILHWPAVIQIPHACNPPWGIITDVKMCSLCAGCGGGTGSHEGPQDPVLYPCDPPHAASGILARGVYTRWVPGGMWGAAFRKGTINDHQWGYYPLDSDPGLVCAPIAENEGSPTGQFRALFGGVIANRAISRRNARRAVLL